MEFECRELRRDGGGASFYASYSSASRFPSDAGLSRYGISAPGGSSQRDQVRQLSYNTDSTFLETGRRIGPPGPSLQDPLSTPSYREDPELENRRRRLREVADRIELAHFRMLEEHDRRALAIAERAPYARRIPSYPELPPDNCQINHTAQGVPHSRSPQRVAPMYHELPGERSEVQKDLNMGPDWGPRAGVEGSPILRREEVVPHVGLDGARSPYQPIGPIEVGCPVGPARDVWIDERPDHDPILQNQFTGYNMMLPPQIIHELPPPLVVPVPVPVPITEKKIGSSADADKKHKKEYGHEMIQVKPTMSRSKWPCVWCSVNFDSKEAMDAHLKEQRCKGDGPSESEKVENNRNEETRNGLTVMSDGDQEISEVSGSRTNKKIQLYLPPANLKRKSNKLQKGDVVPTPENKEVAGSDTNKKIKLDLPIFYFIRKSDEDNKEEVEPTPEDKEIAGSSTTKKIKLDLPPSNLRQTPNEVVEAPENKEIAGLNINRKMKLDLPPSNLKQKPDEPSKEEVVPIPENKEKPATVTTKPGWVVSEDGWFCDLCKINTLTKRTLDDHFQSNAHLEKLNALLNGSQKSEPANKIVAEKPVQEVSRAVSMPRLEEQKEKTSVSILMPQSDKLKEVSSQDKGNPSSSNRTVIMEGHKKTAGPTPKFSKKKNGAPVNGSTKPVLVMKDGKWLCNLCKVKLINEKSKEEHIKGKRHRMNLQSQAVSHTPEPKSNGKFQPGPCAESPCYYCNETGHFKRNCSKFLEDLKKKGSETSTSGAQKESAKLHRCFVCNIYCTNENGLIEHFNGKKHREQNQGCKGNGSSESEKVENNRNEETRTGLTVMSDGDQEEISEVSGPCKNKKIQLELPPFNFKRKSDKTNKEEVEPIPEDREIAGSSTTKKIKLDLPVSNLRQIPNEVVQTPENKEIAGSSINKKMKLDLPPSNLKQKPDEPSEEEVVPIPENKEKPATGTTEQGLVVPEGGWFCGLCRIYTLTKRTLDDHFQSNAHLDKLNALYWSLKFEPANKTVAEKPVQGLSQAVSVPKLEEAKEDTSKSIPMPQSDKLKEATSQDNGNPNSSNRTVILTGHMKTAQQTPKFSNNKNSVPVNGITNSILVMKHGKWFCNLCDAKWMNEKFKEEHIKGKRHRMNLQSQAVSHTPEPNEPSAKLHRCFICNIYCTNENNFIVHLNGKKHHAALMKQMHVA